MVKLWCGDELYEVTGKGFDPTVGGFKTQGGTDANAEKLIRSCVYAGMMCSNCKISQEKDEATGVLKWMPLGNSSEAPIVVAGGKLGYKTEKVAEDHPRTTEIPFSSSLKMMLTGHSTGGKTELGAGGVSIPGNASFLAVVKGAPNFVIDSCKTWTMKDGTTKDLDAAQKAKIMGVIDDLSSQALRVLAVAISPLPSNPLPPQTKMTSDEKLDILRKDLQLLGLFASMDPPRDGVANAVADANLAHIRVVMITGDYVKTAEAIARNINIMEATDGSECACDSAKLRPGGEYLNEAEMRALTASAKVFARAQPEDKLEIVKSLQMQGKVVAMTGDGVNDAPALNRADIGVAMGIQGTEVAKGAAAMILTDDNFVSIVAAVEKGRVIYAGLQKFVCFIMSVHLGEVMQIFTCIVLDIPVMRTPLQILFLILVTDLPPSIALGMEPGSKDILKEYPRPKKQAIVLNWMWQGIVMNGLILTVCALLVYCYCLMQWVGTLSGDKIIEMIGDETEPVGGYSGQTSYNLMRARTSAFVCVVWCENFRAYTSRSFDKFVWVGLLDNAAMQKAIAMAQCALYFVILTPGVRDQIMLLEGPELGIEGWAVGIGGGVLCLIICEIYKFATRSQIARFQESVKQLQMKEQEEALSMVGSKKPPAPVGNGAPEEPSNTIKL
jgi:magnesium-transporting ATPase (P-type)